MRPWSLCFTGPRPPPHSVTISRAPRVYRFYQKSILFWSVTISLFLLGALWFLLETFKLPPGDGSEGTTDKERFFYQQIIVVVFISVEMLVRPLGVPRREPRK